MLALPLLNAVTADRASATNRGRYMGLYTMAYSLAFIFAPALGGWVYGRFGPKVLWFGIGLVGLPLLGGALALGPALRRPVPPRDSGPGEGPPVRV